MRHFKQILQDVLRLILAFPMVLFWLLVLTGMFAPESLIVLIMALGEVDAAQLAGLMRSAVHIWIALSITFALARIAFRYGSSSSRTTSEKEGSQSCA